MTTEQREQLREVLLDYLHTLTSTTQELYSEQAINMKIAQVRLLLREVA